nr:MAG TPA: hypothetical protein [Caudoviricetes sp.]
MGILLLSFVITSHFFKCFLHFSDNFLIVFFTYFLC